MKIGFSKIDITPPKGTLLCGQLVSLPAQSVESRLYATAMYLDDGGTPVVFVSCDVLMITNETAQMIGEEAAKLTGIPATGIIVATTHTHSGPNTVDLFGKETERGYIDFFKSKTVEAISNAQSISSNGELYIAQGQLNGYAFNRRFIMSDGTIETHPLKNDPHIIKPEGPDSKDIFVFYAHSSDGRPLGAAVVFGCHATVMERDNDLISSDYPGKVVTYISEKLGSDAAALFLQGASGNICQVNPLDKSRTEVGVEWAKIMGRAIGQRVVELIDKNKTPVSGNFRVITETITIPRRKIDPDLLAWANRHKEISTEIPYLSNYGVERFGTIKYPTVSLHEMFKTPFWADFYKNEILTLEKLRADEPVLSMTLKVIALDNWACAAIPCELFIELADEICAKSPFEYTAVVELANGWNGYIPTKQAFDRKGGYETKEVTSTMLVPEAADMVLECVHAMLEKAHGTN